MTTPGSPAGSTTTPPPPPAAPYKIRRARKGRMLAGVAQGLAIATGMDVTVVRICIGVSMLSGLGIVGYGLLWLVVPEESPSRGRLAEPAPEQTARIIRIALVATAALGVMKSTGIFWPLTGTRHTDFGFGGIFGLILLTIGIAVLFSRHRPEADWFHSPPPNPGDGSPSAPPAPVDDDDDERPMFVGPFREVAGTVHHDVTTAVHNAVRDRSPRRPGGAALVWARVVGWLVLLWWVAATVGFIALWRFGAINIIAPVVVFAAAWITLIGVLSTLTRVRSAAAVMGSLLLLLIPILLGVVLTRPDGVVGPRTLRPDNPILVRHTYNQAVGPFTLDLSDTKFTKDRTINVDLGAGALFITVPDNVGLTIDTEIHAGGYDVLNKQTNGGVGQSEIFQSDGCTSAPTLHLKLRGGAGWMQVKRVNGHTAATCPAPSNAVSAA